MSPTSHHERRWLILALIGIAQLMIVLDLTIVNIALPSAQQDLGFSDDARQWIITAYALAFGSLLLLGGKLGDLFGRKWAFIGGLLGFAAASAVGGDVVERGVQPAIGEDLVGRGEDARAVALGVGSQGSGLAHESG